MTAAVVTAARQLLRIALPIRLWMSLSKSRSQLAKLDRHLLADIGLTENLASFEAARPFWDAQAHWRSNERAQSDGIAGSRAFLCNESLNCRQSSPISCAEGELASASDPQGHIGGWNGTIRDDQHGRRGRAFGRN